MEASFERLKTIGIETKHLVNGYIRQCQSQLFGNVVIENPYYNIPQLINSHCILFYEVFKWYKKKHGNEMEFISDTAIKLGKRPDTRGSHDAICLFETEISNRFSYTKFDITFKVTTFGDRDYPSFSVGYAFGDSLEESIEEWDGEFGCDSNKESTCGFAFYMESLYYLENGNGNEYQQLEYSLNDLVKLLFDFNEKKVKVYHKSKEVDCRNLKVDRLWVGICLMNEGAVIEMVDYTYHYH